MTSFSISSCFIFKNLPKKNPSAYYLLTEKDEEVRERDQMRYERHKERARDRNLARAAPDKR